MIQAVDNIVDSLIVKDVEVELLAINFQTTIVLRNTRKVAHIFEITRHVLGQFFYIRKFGYFYLSLQSRHFHLPWQLAPETSTILSIDKLTATDPILRDSKPKVYREIES